MKTAFGRHWSCVFLIVLIWVAPAPAQTFKVVYSFAGGSDGATPEGSLVVDASGNLYGTTTYGGIGNPNCTYSAGCGTIFALSPTGRETTLHRFTDGADGGFPGAGLMWYSQGNLIGSTNGDKGRTRHGAIFKFDPSPAS